MDEKKLYNTLSNVVRSPYFTKEFFTTFYKEYRSSIRDEVSGRTMPGKDHFCKTKQADFYQKDSLGYCQFLEEFHDHLPKWRIDLFRDVEGCELVKRIYDRYPDEEMTKNAGRLYARIYDAGYPEVMLVKE